MDFTESIEVVLEKVKELDRENATKIVGYLLLEEHGEQEMIRLAHGTRDMILYSINRAKKALKMVAPTNNLSTEVQNLTISKLPTDFTPFVPSSSRFPTSPPIHEAYNIPIDPYHIPMYDPTMYNYEYAHFPYGGPTFFYHPHFMPMEPFWQYQPPPEGQFGYFPYFQENLEIPLQQTSDQNSPGSSEKRFCERFSRGYCKYGGDCKFLHAVNVTEDYILVLSTPNSNEEVKQYHALSHGSVKELEAEVVGILKSKGPIPVPTAMLPILFQEKYGRKLQPDGYFTEKYMQGKVICGLAELLSHMTSTIRVFERDGETFVILAEDVPKYMQSLEETNKEEQGFDSACQIYLTFPPHSSFTHRDIYDYFEYNFGPVRSVRIPTQEQRMYGFVTFVCQESVTNVLAQGNPHFICGMRVLAKPYRDKHAFNERKLEENPERSTRNMSVVESKHQSYYASRSSSSSSYPKKQQNEEQDQQADRKGKKILATSSHNYLPRGVCINCSAKGKSISMVADDKVDERLEELNLPDSLFGFDVSNRD